jgi:hypothetical protein
VWRNVLPRLAPILPGTSTPAKSAALLAKLLTGQLRGSYNGAYFNYTGKQIEPAQLATEPWVAQDLAAGSERLLFSSLRTLDERQLPHAISDQGAPRFRTDVTRRAGTLSRGEDIVPVINSR